MGGNNSFVCEITHSPLPTRHPAGQIGHTMSKVYEFTTVLDTVRGGWTTSIGMSVAAEMVQIGSGLVRFVVLEGAASLHRYTHNTRTDRHGKK